MKSHRIATLSLILCAAFLHGCAGLGNSATTPGDGWNSSGDTTTTETAGGIAKYDRQISLTKFDKKKVFDLSISSQLGWKTAISPTHIELEDGGVESANYVADVTIPVGTPEGKYAATITITEKTDGEVTIPLEINVVAPTKSKLTQLSPFAVDDNQNFVSSFQIETGAHDGVNNRYLLVDVPFQEMIQYKDPKAGGVSMEPFKTEVYTVKLLPLTNAAPKHFAFDTHIEAVSGVLNVNSTFDVQPDTDMPYTIKSSYDNGVGVSPTGSDPEAEYTVTYDVAAGHPGQFTTSVSGLDPAYRAKVVPATATVSPSGGPVTFTVTIRCNSSYTGAEKYMLARFRLVHSSEPAMDRYLGIPVRIIP